MMTSSHYSGTGGWADLWKFVLEKALVICSACIALFVGEH